MKLIIAGSRGLGGHTLIDVVMQTFVAKHRWPTEVVSGGARGIDSLGEEWARGHNIPVRRFIPDWASYGRAAGPKRNAAMAEYADALMAIWDGDSSGTRHMIATMEVLGKLVEILVPDHPGKSTLLVL